MARPSSGIVWKHNTIWLKDSVWDKVQYFSASSGKKPSAWLIDYVYAFEGEVQRFPKVKTDLGKSRSICVPLDKWEEIKARAKGIGMTASQYVSNILNMI